MKTVQVSRLCDVCPRTHASKAVTTIPLVTDEGERYALDVCADHREKYRAAQDRWRRHARHVTPVRRRKPVRVNATPTQLREWAAKQGIDVAPKGPVPLSVYTAYRRAQINEG